MAKITLHGMVARVMVQKSVLFRPCMCVSTRSGLKGRSVLPTEREKDHVRSA